MSANSPAPGDLLDLSAICAASFTSEPLTEVTMTISRFGRVTALHFPVPHPETAARKALRASYGAREHG